MCTFTSTRFHLAHVPPASIWNMDETGLMYHNVVQHIITWKNVRVEGYNCGNTKARCSVVLACSANGDKLPLFFIFKGTHYNPEVPNKRTLGYKYRKYKMMTF
eukprot:PhM_4_TR2119/c2_g1_i4/m.57442